jgi:hypothetical protein
MHNPLQKLMNFATPARDTGTPPVQGVPEIDRSTSERRSLDSGSPDHPLRDATTLKLCRSGKTYGMHGGTFRDVPLTL